MMPLDDELRSLLRRREPPPGFAGRVLARAASSQRPKRRPRWVPAAIAACLLLAIGAVEYGRAWHARRELLLGLRITSQKLALVQNKVEQISQRTIP